MFTHCFCHIFTIVELKKYKIVFVRTELIYKYMPNIVFVCTQICMNKNKSKLENHKKLCVYDMAELI